MLVTAYTTILVISVFWTIALSLLIVKHAEKAKHAIEYLSTTASPRLEELNLTELNGRVFSDLITCYTNWAVDLIGFAPVVKLNQFLIVFAGLTLLLAPTSLITLGLFALFATWMVLTMVSAYVLHVRKKIMESGTDLIYNIVWSLENGVTDDQKERIQKLATNDEIWNGLTQYHRQRKRAANVTGY